MPLYVISYDLRKQRTYEPLWKALREWKAAKLLESFWLAELTGPAGTIRDILKAHIDHDDGLVVLELRPNFDWAYVRALKGGTDWLQRQSP
jgi:hypothetical protein